MFYGWLQYKLLGTVAIDSATLLFSWLCISVSQHHLFLTQCTLSVVVARKQTNLFKKTEVTATHFLLLYLSGTFFLCSSCTGNFHVFFLYWKTSICLSLNFFTGIRIINNDLSPALVFIGMWARN